MHSFEDVVSRPAEDVAAINPYAAADIERQKKLIKAVEETAAKYPGQPLWHIEADDYDVLFTKPNDPQCAEALSKGADKSKNGPSAMKMLAFQIVRFPSPEEFRAIAADLPLLPMRIANDALAIAGGERPDAAKKVWPRASNVR